VTERLSHGAPTFFVANKTFVTVWAKGHHDHTFPHLWCAGPPGRQEALVQEAPVQEAGPPGRQEALVQEAQKFFRPPYVGHRGWIGVRLDDTLDWDEIADLCEDAYRVVAPRRLVALLDSQVS
jgi:hypothetical protein